MNQDKHLFQFTGQQIAYAAYSEADYHMTRLAWWTKSQDDFVKRAQNLTAIVKVREWQHTGGKGYEIYADIVDIQNINVELRRCGKKMEAHRKAAEEYRLKASAYSTQPNRAYELDPGDVAYFRMAGAERPE